MAGIGTNFFAGGNASATASTDSQPALAAATYGPAASGAGSPFSPRKGQGLGFWFAVGGVVVLVCIRQSLPR